MPKNENQVAAHMATFMTKFVELYPELKNRKIYITGESYAGHYIPFIADKLPVPEYKNQGINVVGVAIGNGWVMPVD